jgi:hypothetical protein
MTAILALLMGATLQPDPNAILMFERQRIGTGTYEAASAFDVDRDGTIDIVSGEYWYAGPDFTVAHKIRDIAQVSDYFDDFADYPMDVNGDGYTDIVTGGWWGATLQWVENPQGQPVPWTVHDVEHVGSIERDCFYDIDQDGQVEVFPVSSPVLCFKLVRDAAGKGTGVFEKHLLTEEGGGGHGIGFGDVNGDGRPDLLFAGGWLEAPVDTFGGKWAWHPEWNLGGASVPILVHDVNGDGLADVIVGAAHDYGLDWYAQGKTGEERTWTRHAIDPYRSQYHDLQLVDLDKDGQLELLTGKRYRAHAENDPGSLDPVGVYYFEIGADGEFTRRTLDYGPAGRASGAGIYLWVEDVDGNGWPDVIAPGKDGLYLFRSLGPAESAK